MAIIEVKHDPNIKLEEIIELNANPAPGEQDHVEANEYQQTKITGIIAPLIRLNNITINFGQIYSFKLENTNKFPTVNIIIGDAFDLIKSLDIPQTDNLLRVEILPPFDNAYKKINLRFYITDITISGEIVNISAIYNIPELYNCRLESFGEKTTYELFDEVSNKLQLGLASNISGTDDKRWIYCNNCSYKDILDKEIEYGGGNENIILDYWIDWHNYINLVDIRERYEAIDKNKDLKIWVNGGPTGIPQSEINQKVIIQELDGLISNARAMEGSPLYCVGYNIINNTGNNVFSGTDKVCEFYNISDLIGDSYLIQDNNANNDIFTKTIYLGEKFGEYNYLLQKICNSAFKQKIYTQCISVELGQPCLGLERGHRVNFEWYEINSIINPKKDIPTNSNILGDDGLDEQGNVRVPGRDEEVMNKQISGQYLILGSIITYNKINNKPIWKHKLLLGRPNSEINNYI